MLLLPILISVSLRASTHVGHADADGLRDPVGGMSTTIGTSTNLLVVGVASDLRMRQLGMFDFFVPVAVAGGIGAMLYLWLRRRLLAGTSDRIWAMLHHAVCRATGDWC